MSKSSSKGFYPEYVEWLDHCSFTASQWRTQEESKRLKPLTMQSLGWVIKETKKYILLSPHHGAESDNVDGTLCILKNCIVERYRVCKR